MQCFHCRLKYELIEEKCKIYKPWHMFYIEIDRQELNPLFSSTSCTEGAIHRLHRVVCLSYQINPALGIQFNEMLNLTRLQQHCSFLHFCGSQIHKGKK